MKRRYNVNLNKHIHDRAVKACKLISKKDNDYMSLSARIEVDLIGFIKQTEELYGVKL